MKLLDLIDNITVWCSFGVVVINSIEPCDLLSVALYRKLVLRL